MSGRGPKYRSRALPNTPRTSSTDAPAEITVSAAPGMASPAGSPSVKWPCDQVQSKSSVSHGFGL